MQGNFGQPVVFSQNFLALKLDLIVMQIREANRAKRAIAWSIHNQIAWNLSQKIADFCVTDLLITSAEFLIWSWLLWLLVIMSEALGLYLLSTTLPKLVSLVT